MDSSIVIADLKKEVEIPADGIISRTLSDSPAVKVVLFGFDAGQELSEHTASVPAAIEILSGKATVVIGGAVSEAGPGFWALMPPHAPHSIRAHEPTVMLLYMIRTAKAAG